MKIKYILVSLLFILLPITGCRMREKLPIPSPLASMLPSAMTTTVAPTATPTATNTPEISATAKVEATPTPKGTAKATAMPTAKAIPTMNPESTNLGDFQREVFRLVNAERVKAKVAPLMEGDAALNTAAETRAMELNKSFSHTRPSGEDCFSVLGHNNISYYACGENIAAGQQTPAQVVEAWMNSSGHRANVLNPNFTHMAVGIDKGGNMGMYWCQLFIG